MADILERIVASKREEIAAAKTRMPESVLREQAQYRADRRPFLENLKRPGVNIIAEIKRASPSKGLICPDLDPARNARAYEAGGAAALSVLTDGPFFKGCPKDLAAARGAASLPVLRKDFMIDPYQFHEAAAMGADAVLLIVRILSLEKIRDFLALSDGLGLAALVEVHDAREADTALAAGALLIGINNRDLSSFHTDLGRSADMAVCLGPEIIRVAESGIRGPEDVRRLRHAGFANFLVGESCVRAPDPAAFIRALREESS